MVRSLNELIIIIYRKVPIVTTPQKRQTPEINVNFLWLLVNPESRDPPPPEGSDHSPLPKVVNCILYAFNLSINSQNFNVQYRKTFMKVYRFKEEALRFSAFMKLASTKDLEI